MNKTDLNFSSILFIDSGIGGLTTLVETLKIINTNVIYFADNKFAPYGTKSETFLKNRLTQIINRITKQYNISTVVLACNTATTSSIAYLRNKFNNICFIGTEPAYKTAINLTFKNPLLIATPQTINQLSSKNIPIHLVPKHSLASTIESNHIEKNPISNYNILKEIYILCKQIKKHDCLILGCTHYIFIKDKLSKIIKIPIIDGNQGVAKQISKNYCHESLKFSTVKIILSNKKCGSLQKYKKILKQILANSVSMW